MFRKFITAFALTILFAVFVVLALTPARAGNFCSYSSGAPIQSTDIFLITETGCASGSTKQALGSDIVTFLSGSQLDSLFFNSAQNQAACTSALEGTLFYNSATNAFNYCDGSSNTAFGGISNVVEDTSPQLGGELDAGGNNIIDLGDVTFQTGATGGTLRTGTSAADKFTLQAYDVNGGAYTTVFEVDAGNDPMLQFFVDTLFFEDRADATKQAKLDVSGVTTGTVRTLTVPDASGTLALTTSNVATATALAANGANCSAGSAPLGVDASGAVESCTDYEEDLSNSAGLAAALSDETGSGAAVFGTSPSLTTPAIAGSSHTGANTFAAGTGAGTYQPSGLIDVELATVGNVTTGEDDLSSYVLPASSLSASGKCVRVTALGTAANNANAKTVRAYINSTTIINNGTMAANLAGEWYMEIMICSTGTDAQKIFYSFERDSAGVTDVILRNIITATEDDGAAITIKFTGEGTATNDVVQEWMTTEMLN